MCDASVSVNWCCLPIVSLVMVGMPSCRQLSGALCNFDAPSFSTAQCAQAANCPFALGSSKNTTSAIGASELTAERSSAAGQARTYL